MLDDLYGDLAKDVALDFHLTYRGPLRPTQNDPKPGTPTLTSKWNLKHDMRLQFHEQLKALWEIHPLLAEKGAKSGGLLSKQRLSEQNSIPPWNFVPLVIPELEVFCGLEINLLRLDHPGDSVWAGDVDNRIKTLIDALTVPTANANYANIKPQGACNPLYVLFQTDKIMTSLSVETGRLLKAPPDSDESYAELTIRVKIKPENVTMLNLGL